MAVKRMQFIPEIRDKIIKSCRGLVDNEITIELAITSWEEGHDPMTPVEHGVFAVCARIEQDINDHWRHKHGDTEADDRAGLLRMRNKLLEHQANGEDLSDSEHEFLERTKALGFVKLDTLAILIGFGTVAVLLLNGCTS